MIKIEFNPGSKELAKVVGYYNLLEYSSQYKVVCPFHADINASLLINLEEGSYYCFGCNRHGNALDFVKDANPRLNDLKVLMAYFKILKSKRTKNIDVDRNVIKRKVERDKAHEFIIAQDFYINLLTIDWETLISPVKDYMLERGFSPKTLNKVKAKLTYNDNYPIILPMNDMGQFRGWVCRTNNPEIEKKRKYLYNKGFSRATTLVGKYDNEVVVLVEGFMDYLKMKQFGVTYVAAILGWKITSNQIAKLKAMGVKHIISALDVDDCGEKGTKELQKYFQVTRFEFPEGVKDPGDLDIKSFKEANKKTIKKYRRNKNGFSKSNQKERSKVRK